MALPTTRNTTYASLSQVKSADLNDIQDKIIDIHVSGKHGERILTVDASNAQGDGSAAFASGGTGPSTPWWASNAGTDFIVHPIRLPAGSRITSVTVWIDLGGGGGTMTLKLYRKDQDDANGTATQVGSTATNSGGNLQELVVSSGTGMPYTVLDEEPVWALLDPSASGHKVFGMKVVYDRP